MKLLKYNLAFLLCFAAAFLCGCSNDDDVVQLIQKATIKFEKTGTEPVLAYPGDVLSFSVDMTASAGIKKVITILDGVEVSGSAKDYPNGTDSGSYSAAYTVQTGEVGKTLNFIIEAYDENGKKSTAEYIVYVQAARPNIEIKIPDTAPQSVTSGDVIQFDVEVTSEFALKHITTYLGTSEIAGLRKETFSDPNSDSYSFAYTTTDLDAGQTLTFVFEVMNENGSVEKIEYQVEVVRAAELDINEFYSLQIGAQSSTIAGPYLNTTAGEIYARIGAAAKSASIDIMLFYSNSSYGYYFVSPSDTTIETIFGGANDPISGWTQRNNTKIKDLVITPTDFLAINSANAIKTLYDNSSSPEVSKMTTKLTVNTVVAFKTESGKYGVIIVRSHANGSSSGNVTVDMKVEK